MELYSEHMNHGCNGLLWPESARIVNRQQKVPPQAQKVPLGVALTTAITPWVRDPAQLSPFCNCATHVTLLSLLRVRRTRSCGGSTSTLEARKKCDNSALCFTCFLAIRTLIRERSLQAYYKSRISDCTLGTLGNSPPSPEAEPRGLSHGFNLSNLDIGGWCMDHGGLTVTL